MTKDIIFIHPPNPVLIDPTMYFSLGLLYVAAYAIKENFKVGIVDFRDKTLDVSLVPRAPNYGITATSGEINNAKKLSKMLKERDPESNVIIGGPHASLLPDDCMEDFDTVVRGEGEKAIPHILRTGKRKLVSLPPIKDLDLIPFPARYLLPERSIFSYYLFPGTKYGTSAKATTLISTRGCPYKCAFCANIPQPVRFRSAENFVAEIKHLIKRYNCYHYHFVDDNFTLNEKRLKEICNKLEPLKVHFRCHTRANLVSEEVCKWLKKGGCRELALGVETGDNEVLKLMNKKLTIEENLEAVKIIKDSSLISKVFLVVGFPGETWKSIEKTKEFMRKAKPHKWTLSTFTPYPGCEVWRNPEKFGVKILTKNWDHYWNFPDISVIETDVASNKELMEHREDLWKFLISEEWRK